MSGRTATWKQPVHSTFVLTVNKQVGRSTPDVDSCTHARTGYQSLTSHVRRSATPFSQEPSVRG
eukprot:6059646-Prymnesium_polylepis.1